MMNELYGDDDNLAGDDDHEGDLGDNKGRLECSSVSGWTVIVSFVTITIMMIRDDW